MFAHDPAQHLERLFRLGRRDAAGVLPYEVCHGEADGLGAVQSLRRGDRVERSNQLHR
jgi:hypothetical protein